MFDKCLLMIIMLTIFTESKLISLIERLLSKSSLIVYCYKTKFLAFTNQNLWKIDIVSGDNQQWFNAKLIN